MVNKAKNSFSALTAGLLFALIGGCATSPTSYTLLEDEQVIEEPEKSAKSTENPLTQHNYPQARAAPTATPKESGASHLSGGIAGVQPGVRQESAKPDAQAQVTVSTPPPAQHGPLETHSSSPPPSQPQPNAQVESPVQTTAPDFQFPVYSGNSQEHWVSEVFSNGRYVLLEDSSVWEIESIDTIDTGLWLMTEEIVILTTQHKGYLFYDLINTDSKDKVAANYLGVAVLRTQIEGDFEGWDGDTVFELANGNILKQLQYSYTYHYAYRPDAVVFEQNGLLFLLVDGVDETIGVMVIR